MNDPSTYTRLRERLDEIVVQVRAKDVPLEKSLDLYEEALRLGSRCAEMIDRTDFSAEELESISEEAASQSDEASDEGVTGSDESHEDDNDHGLGDSSEGGDPGNEETAESR